MIARRKETASRKAKPTRLVAAELFVTKVAKYTDFKIAYRHQNVFPVRLLKQHVNVKQ